MEFSVDLLGENFIPLQSQAEIGGILCQFCSVLVKVGRVGSGTCILTQNVPVIARKETEKVKSIKTYSKLKILKLVQTECSFL